MPDSLKCRDATNERCLFPSFELLEEDLTFTKFLWRHQLFTQRCEHWLLTHGRINWLKWQKKWFDKNENQNLNENLKNELLADTATVYAYFVIIK